MTVLREEGKGELTGVLHCFSGTADLARAGLDLGFYISFAGMLTFNNAGALRETARLVPLDRLLTETDSPFLAPVPHRGKRNEPAFVVACGGGAGAIARHRRAGNGSAHHRKLSSPLPAVIKFQPEPRVEKTPALSQIFEPIRGDLELVDREFVRHVESQVARHSANRPVHPDERRQAGAARRAPHGRRGWAAIRAIAPSSTPPSSSSFTRRRSSTTTSSTTRSCGADAWPSTRAGATTSRCSSATTSTSSRWRWRSRTTRSTSCACCATSRCG